MMKVSTFMHIRSGCLRGGNPGIHFHDTERFKAEKVFTYMIRFTCSGQKVSAFMEFMFPDGRLHESRYLYPDLSIKVDTLSSPGACE